MGHLVRGKWESGNVATSNKQGEFDRERSIFRESVCLNHPKYPPENNRYHLYVSLACPWAHRTLITRKLKGLEETISVSVVHPHMLDKSWTFESDFPGSTGDTLMNKKFLYEIYLEHDPNITTKVTVPIFWDKKTNTIINNESSEIIRILNNSFNEFAKNDIDLYPKTLSEEIDVWNDKIYEPVNNGVYKTGFAKTQSAYEKAFHKLFEVLDELENHLSHTDYLVGNTLTEADVRLITTLLRFDAVYFGHFKCNKKRIADYPALLAYTKRLYALDAIRSTTDIAQIKEHYYYSHEFLNPSRIVPLGPEDLF